MRSQQIFLLHANVSKLNVIKWSFRISLRRENIQKQIKGWHSFENLSILEVWKNVYILLVISV